MALDSMQEIFDKIQAGRKPFWQVVRDTDVEERPVSAFPPVSPGWLEQRLAPAAAQRLHRPGRQTG